MHFIVNAFKFGAKQRRAVRTAGPISKAFSWYAKYAIKDTNKFHMRTLKKL